MYLARIIIYTGVFMWLLPPIRQFKGGFRYFFLVIAISDPIALFVTYILKLHPGYSHIVTSFILFLTALYYCKNLTSKNISIGALLLIIMMLSIQWIGLELPIIVFRFLILLQMLNYLQKDMYIRQTVNLYIIIIIVYELANVFKFVGLALEFYPGIYYFYLTTAFNLLPCMYFIFFNWENSPKFTLEGVK